MENELCILGQLIADGIATPEEKKRYKEIAKKYKKDTNQIRDNN